MSSRNEMKDTLTILMAGGKGERLYPLTKARAKPAVWFGGIYRIVDFTLSNCLNSDIRRIYVLTQYRSLSLDRHIRLGWSVFNHELGEFIECVPPQQRNVDRWYRGTADSIYQNIYLLQRERPQRVLILSGDHVYKMNYNDMLSFHMERNAELTVAGVEIDRSEATHFGVIGSDDNFRIIDWEEKPANPKPVPGKSDKSFVSMGVYIFNTDTLVKKRDCGCQGCFILARFRQRCGPAYDPQQQGLRPQLQGGQQRRRALLERHRNNRRILGGQYGSLLGSSPVQSLR